MAKLIFTANIPYGETSRGKNFHGVNSYGEISFRRSNHRIPDYYSNIPTIWLSMPPVLIVVITICTIVGVSLF